MSTVWWMWIVYDNTKKIMFYLSKSFITAAKKVNFFIIKAIFLSTNSMSSKNFPKTLLQFGYAFNDEGLLKKIDKENGKPGSEGFQFESQEHYEALGDVITEHIYELLLQNGMEKIYIPNNTPKEQSTFIFTNKKILENSKKLLILIHGSGVVRAGQWSRSLIINHSLDHGTQIPYLKRAQSLGYDIIITNTNDNYRNNKIIPNNKSPIEHAQNVWEKYVINSNPESVAIIAHSYGGVVTVDLAKKYPEFFRNKVFAIGFTDSVHSTAGLSKENSDYMKKIGRNWVTSTKPLDELLRESNNDIARHSAGHTKHEWTSYTSIDAVFKFFEQKYEEFKIQKSDKHEKLEL